MTDASSIPPFAPSDAQTSSDVAETLRGAADKVSGAIQAGRQPGMPLSILSNIAREAPLGSLLVAFLLGVAVARRR
jgi:hypothetical protein